MKQCEDTILDREDRIEVRDHENNDFLNIEGTMKN